MLDTVVLDEAVMQLRTLQDLLRWAATQFNAAPLHYGHGADNAWDEALQLVLTGLQLPIDLPENLYTARLTTSERQRLVAWIRQRIQQRIPVAYLTQRAWFCGLEFYVDERVLVPRSPIGELIQNHFAGNLTVDPHRILDMCTGSGCIAIACAYRYPHADIDAVDISQDALAVAEHNIQRHALEQRITTLCSDLFQQLPVDHYDIIIANPPYVGDEALAELPAEYHHEPPMGLAAEAEGLALVARILADSPPYLSDNGLLIIEVGDGRSLLQAYYPKVPFTWLPLKRGGQGVLMLTRQQLAEAGLSSIEP